MSSARVNLYVTLRCAQLFQNGYTLYAGCGVNEDSDPEVEWNETAAKMALLGKFL
jgi:isochorismate synthase